MIIKIKLNVNLNKPYLITFSIEGLKHMKIINAFNNIIFIYIKPILYHYLYNPILHAINSLYISK